MVNIVVIACRSLEPECESQSQKGEGLPGCGIKIFDKGVHLDEDQDRYKVLV